MLHRTLHACLAIAVLGATSFAQAPFVNWEDPHVHPLDMTPDGTRLLAVNTPDATLEVFDTTGAKLVPLFSVPVGIDPISVRARTNDEVWIVNHISDSISIVKLSTQNVVDTIKTDDEPADVVFAGSPQRAFVSCSQVNKVQVFDPANTQAAPIVVPIVGEEPRAMAVSLDGTKVYVAIFESGNATTILAGGALSNNTFPRNVVSDFNGPYSGQNPPPNSGTTFNPPINPALPTPPKVGLIVRKTGPNQWMDDNAHNWADKVSGANAANSNRVVGWDMPDDDVAIIDVATPTNVTYAHGLMNLCMAIAVNPASGEITVVGTESTNEIRFEPIVRGKFIKVRMARVDPAVLTNTSIYDLNPHLNYATATLPQIERDRSIGDPRAIAWEASGTRAWIAGMGSNNVVVTDVNGARSGLSQTIEVPEGPTGLAVDAAHGRVYVLSKFASVVSTISSATETVVDTTPFHDASPVSIKNGRKHLYATRATSGLGQISCASCHVDARMDGLAWDLGDPSGSMRSVSGNNLRAGFTQLSPFFEDIHPMKGPMATQTLQDIVGLEPFHWRGDRKGIEEFNPAYQNLQGDDTQLTPAQMAEFESFLTTIYYPPNPFRNFDNSLPTSLPMTGHFTTGIFAPAGAQLPNGNAVTGLSNHRTLALDNGALRCVLCHTLPTGVGTDYTVVGGTLQPIAPGADGERHTMLVANDPSTNVTMKVPQLRNQYEKTGFTLRGPSTRGFGYLHDGSFDTVERFIADSRFAVTSDQMISNLTAFMLAFSGSDLPTGSTVASAQEPLGPPSHDTHAAVGRQLTLRAAPTTPESTLLASMTALGDANKVGLVMKGVRGGLVRGAAYSGSSNWQSDRAGETWTTTQLTSGAALGNEITFTVVPKGTEVRIGVDRDLDTWRDRDETDLGSDPADAASFPGAPGAAYCFGDGSGTACPCGNASNVGDASGCVNSIGTGGKLVVAGTAKISQDTLTLSGSGMPNYSPVLYFQGTTSIAGGSGTVFGDGLLCVGGTTARLWIKVNAGGGSQFPEAGDPSVSASGAVTLPGTRTYQGWYRDAATFCTVDGFSLTNAWRVVWAP